MLSLIVLAMIILTIILFKLAKKNYQDEYWVVFWFCVASSLILAGIWLSTIGSLVEGRALSTKIEMYQEQNAQIESQVEAAVKTFMNHEDKVFSDATTDSYITLVSLYPELKSDELISKQINVYLENNEKICELKEEQIDLQKVRFWLYFGK